MVGVLHSREAFDGAGERGSAGRGIKGVFDAPPPGGGGAGGRGGGGGGGGGLRRRGFNGWF
jgi:hypothetical protein